MEISSTLVSSKQAQIIAQPLCQDVIQASFNIMPGRGVTETFTIKSIDITGNRITALFDREYVSAMRASPNHITMTVLPLLTQRAFYIWCCEKLGLDSDTEKNEQLKIWPSRIEFIYPQLMRDSEDVIYEMEIDVFEERRKNRFFASGRSHIRNVLQLNAEASVIVL